MKRIVALLLVILMTLSLTACGDGFESDPDTTGGHFAQVFKENVNSSLEDIAKAIADDAMFGGHTANLMPVEEGALEGFGGAEITGFASGLKMGSASINFPFVGYIFELKEDTDVDAFKQHLKDNADLKFNGINSADQVVVENIDNKVIVIITPEKIDKVETVDKEGNPVENEIPVYGGDFEDTFE